MEKRLIELTNKKFLTMEEMREIYSMSIVNQIDYNGYSVQYIGYYCYTIHVTNDEKYNIYTKNIF